MIRLVSWWNEWFSRFLSWRVRHIKERNFLIVLSMLVGIITGLAGVLLKNSVHFTHLFFTEHLQIDSGSLLFFVYPFIGILLTSLFVRYCVPEDINHGVTKVLYAISRQNSMIRPHNSYSSMIASTVTIGFGGSVGTEATIVLTGASIGSNLARFFHMNYKVMTLMKRCGPAEAIAGIYNAPMILSDKIDEGIEKTKDLSDKEIEHFVNNAFDEIISKKDYEHLLFGEQNRFLTKSLKDESIRICKAIHFQNRHSKYKIVFTEYNFSTNGKPLPEIVVYQSKKVLKLKGKVDRIDFFKNRFRVLDYKTGKHKAEFKLLDLYLGRKMQLFIYLYALTKLFPDSTPTGAFYFPINNEYQDKKANSQFENYAYNGVTVNTEENFLAQDDLVSVDNPKSSIINFSLDVTHFNHTGEKLMKDTANALTENQMRALIDYAYALCGKALAEILDGYIEPKPLAESCTFCAVKNFCPFLRKEHQPRTDDFTVDKTTFEEVLK